jgi:hypothetical protein
MSFDTINILFGAVHFSINLTMMCIIFPLRFSRAFTVLGLVLSLAAFYAGHYWLFETLAPRYGGLPALVFLPVSIAFFKARLFHILFAYFLQFFITSIQVVLSLTLSGYFARYGGYPMVPVFVTSMICMIIVYIFLTFGYARRFFNSLFSYNRPSEWLYYSLGLVFAFSVVMARRLVSDGIWVDLLLLLFILWSVGILCYTIITLHAKAKHKYEAEFARSIISSGSEHYKKMDSLRDTLRVMQHDYKYHLDTMSQLLRSGKPEETEKYLDEIRKKHDGDNLSLYCSNPVLNALIASYAERCRENKAAIIPVAAFYASPQVTKALTEHFPAPGKPLSQGTATFTAFDHLHITRERLDSLADNHPERFVNDYNANTKPTMKAMAEITAVIQAPAPKPAPPAPVAEAPAQAIGTRDTMTLEEVQKGFVKERKTDTTAIQREDPAKQKAAAKGGQ